MISLIKGVQNFTEFRIHFEFLDRMNTHTRGKALRVPRAVNIGWRFTARMQVDPLCLSMRFRKICTVGCVFLWHQNFESRSRNRSRPTGAEQELFWLSRPTGAAEERFGAYRWHISIEGSQQEGGEATRRAERVKVRVIALASEQSKRRILLAESHYLHARGKPSTDVHRAKDP